MLNKLFGKSKTAAQKEKEKELTVEDLVTLERYDEAAELLKQRIKMVPKDLHAHLKLAEVYVALKQATKALDEYGFVADTLADDGFHDKAVALLTKAAKINPGDESIPRRMEKYRRLKEQEKRRDLAIEGLMANQSTTSKTAGNTQVQIQLLWNKIAKSPVVSQLEPEQLKKLFSVMEMSTMKVGEVLASGGEIKPLIYMVVDGTVEAEADVAGRKMNVRNFTTGDLIGDAALLENRAWAATYKVTQNGTVFRLSREGLQVAMTGLSDPRQFLSVLRVQGNDRDVAANIQRLAR